MARRQAATSAAHANNLYSFECTVRRSVQSVRNCGCFQLAINRRASMPEIRFSGASEACRMRSESVRSGDASVTYLSQIAFFHFNERAHHQTMGSNTSLHRRSTRHCFRRAKAYQPDPPPPPPPPPDDPPDELLGEEEAEEMVLVSEEPTLLAKLLGLVHKSPEPEYQLAS